MTAASEAAALRHPEKTNNPVQPAPRKPDWLRVKAPMSREYQETRDLMRAIEDATGRSLEAFFDQWVMRGGHPQLEVSSEHEDE